MLHYDDGGPNADGYTAYNPKLKVQLNQDYFDLGTPCFEGVQETRRLPIPHSLAGNGKIGECQSAP